MPQHVTSFPWKDSKNFPFGMSQYFIVIPALSQSGHGLSRYVTGCHVKSKEKLGVAKSQKQLYKKNYIIFWGLSNPLSFTISHTHTH
jgi:hypothetical protein